MLHSMDSMEFAQWMAFERAHGPISGEWDAETQAGIHEQLQQISYLLGQAHFTDKTRKRGPIPKPERYPRPYEAFTKVPLASDELEDEAEWLPPTEDELLEVTIDPAELEAEPQKEI